MQHQVCVLEGHLEGHRQEVEALERVNMDKWASPHSVTFSGLFLTFWQPWLSQSPWTQVSRTSPKCLMIQKQTNSNPHSFHTLHVFLVLLIFLFPTHMPLTLMFPIPFISPELCKPFLLYKGVNNKKRYLILYSIEGVDRWWTPSLSMLLDLYHPILFPI
jgi:hypothetical protein